MIHWLTTAPNPISPSTGYDAGQKGWRLHAVNTEATKFSELRYGKRALCGVLPAHGWSMDMFIEDKCKRCVEKLKVIPLSSG